MPLQSSETATVVADPFDPPVVFVCRLSKIVNDVEKCEATSLRSGLGYICIYTRTHMLGDMWKVERWVIWGSCSYGAFMVSEYFLRV